MSDFRFGSFEEAYRGIQTQGIHHMSTTRFRHQSLPMSSRLNRRNHGSSDDQPVEVEWHSVDFGRAFNAFRDRICLVRTETDPSSPNEFRPAQSDYVSDIQV